MTITTVALDADDTLWHNESIFHLTQDQYVDLLKDYGEPNHMRARLQEVEIKNLKLYGYGVKSFTLSMIETAIDLTRGRRAGEDHRRDHGAGGVPCWSIRSSPCPASPRRCRR